MVFCKERVPCSWPSGLREAFLSYKNIPTVCPSVASRNPFEFIPIYGPRCLRGKEAPALAGGPCTGLRSCPPAFLALIRVTVDALPCLVPPCEAAVPAQKACCDALHHCRMHLIRWLLTVKSG